jgi:lipopolysaccharide biosynthesis glycosyltransferase
MSLPQDDSALYVDSDVLFFPGARTISSLSGQSDAPALYLADCRLSADERLYRSEIEKKNPVNTGVLFLTRKIDWSKSMARLLELEAAPNFFTNQTMTHLAMTTAGAVPLDPLKFVLQLDDQFEFSDRYAGPDLVLRHYVNPVRHKFWTTLARGKLSS